MGKTLAAFCGGIGGVIAAFAACYLLQTWLPSLTGRVVGSIVCGGFVGAVVGSMGGETTRQDQRNSNGAVIGLLMGAITAGLVGFYHDDAMKLLERVFPSARIG
jgi:hypothetical protein